MDAATAEGGLTAAAVEQRRRDGHVNRVPAPPGRSFGQIVAANVFTPVNAIIVALFVLIVIAGYIKDGLFVGVVVSNSLVGIIQEFRARRELERLQVLTEPTAAVIRDGERQVIDVDEIVLDDVVELSIGGEVAIDGDVIASSGLQLDESMLTGESEPVAKGPGDTVLSGSFVVSGSGRVVATAVGADSFASTLAAEAKAFATADSQLRQGVDRILRWLTFVIPIASVLLFLSLLSSEDRWQEAVQGTVAAAVAMVPDGLVLLTSVAFVAGMVQLTRRNALAKQLPTVEILARVDVLCLDKTGTITTGDITLAKVHAIDREGGPDVNVVLAAIAASDDAPNATMQAVAKGVGDAPPWTVVDVEPFSSARKWSAANFTECGWMYLGAPDFLLADDDPARELVAELSGAGQRVLALVTSENGPDGDTAPPGSTTLAIIELEDEIRPDAAEILAYFGAQHVTLKVISGDNPETVAAIARRAGLDSGSAPMDARSLPTGIDELADALERSTVFGRVAPRQKQDMVRALQSRGHTVAMTGDGVNDVLALKDADLGVSMGSGSEASKSVADLVLVDNAFSTLPLVVDEGRKVINNVERVSNLFISKTAYAVVLTLVVGLLRTSFPLLPRQLTLIGTFSIGVPGVFLALAPSVELVKPGFLGRVLRFSIPAGVAAGAVALVAFGLAQGPADLTLDQARTVVTITLLALGLVILATVSRPFRPWKFLLVAAMAASYVFVIVVPFTRDYFELHVVASEVWWWVAGLVVAGGVFIASLPWILERWDRGRKYAENGSVTPIDATLRRVETKQPLVFDQVDFTVRDPVGIARDFAAPLEYAQRVEAVVVASGIEALMPRRDPRIDEFLLTWTDDEQGHARALGELMNVIGLEPTPIGDAGLPLHNRLISMLAARSESLHDVVTTIWALAGAMNEHLAMAAYNRMDLMLRQRGEEALHQTLFRLLRSHESAHKSFYWAVAADNWKRLHPWQQRLTRLVVTKTYAPVGAGEAVDRPALARTIHALGRDDWNEAIVEPVQGVADRLLGPTEPFVRRAFDKCLVTDPLGIELLAPTGT